MIVTLKIAQSGSALQLEDGRLPPSLVKVNDEREGILCIQRELSFPGVTHFPVSRTHPLPVG